MKLQNLSSGQPQWTPSSQSCHAAGRLWKRSFPVAPHHDHGKPRNEWSSYFLDTTLESARDRNLNFLWAGEEELLANYLLSINNGERGFALPDEPLDAVHL